MVAEPYAIRLLSSNQMQESAHPMLQPFAQIPTSPDNAKVRARAIPWMFAALNTVELPLVDRAIATLFAHDEVCPAMPAGLTMRSAPVTRLTGSGLLKKYPIGCAYVAQLAVATGRIPMARQAGPSAPLPCGKPLRLV
ncbi:MAG TPA: hypothetical protein VHW25_03565 [Steroidobacteraceae bacterium]|nr:hypothetical protein [Steroidobacteraceae bacterium]